MKYKNIIITIITSILMFVMYQYYNQELSRDTSQALRVGIASGYAPFISMNAQGHYEGFDIDVVHALGQQMGKQVVLKDFGSMASLFMALEQNKIDMIAWGLSITSDRLDKVAMVHYQGASTDAYSLLFYKQIPEHIITLEDMQNMIVCVEPASAQEVIIDKYPAIKKLSTEKVDDALLNIQYGKALAAFVEPAIAQKFKHKYPEIQVLDISLSEQDKPQGIGFALKKGNRDMIKAVEQAVHALQVSGIIKQLELKWDIPS